MQKWQYSEILVKNGSVEFQDGIKAVGHETWRECLTDMGNNGWDLIIKVPEDARSLPNLYFVATFKRPME